MTTIGVGFLWGMLKRHCCVIGVHVRVEEMNSQTCFQHNPHNKGNVELSYPYLSHNDLQAKTQRSQ